MTIKNMKADINTLIGKNAQNMDAHTAAAVVDVCNDNNARYIAATADKPARVAWTSAARKADISAVYDYIFGLFAVDYITADTAADTDTAPVSAEDTAPTVEDTTPAPVIVKGDGKARDAAPLDRSAVIQAACASYATRHAARAQDAVKPVKGNADTANTARINTARALARAEVERKDAAARADAEKASAEKARLTALKDAKKASKAAAAVTAEDKGNAAAAVVIDDVISFSGKLAAAVHVRMDTQSRAALVMHKLRYAAARAYIVAADKGGKKPRRRYIVVTPVNAAADTSRDTAGKVRAVADTVTDTAAALIDYHAGKIAYQSLRTCDARQRETRKGSADVYIDATGKVLDAPTYADLYSSAPYTSKVLEQAPVYSAYERRRAAAAENAAPVSDVVNHKYSMVDTTRVLYGVTTSTRAGKKPYFYGVTFDAAAMYAAPVVPDTYSGHDTTLYAAQIVEGATPAAAYLTDWHTPALYTTRRARARLANSAWTEVVGTTAGNARAADVLDTLSDYADIKQVALCAYYQLVYDGALSNLADIRAFDRLVYAAVNGYINGQARESTAAAYDVAPDYFTRVSAAAGNRTDDNGADVAAADTLDNVDTMDAIQSAIDAVSAEYNTDTGRVLYYLAHGYKVREIASMPDISYGKSWVHKTVKKVRAWLIKNPEIFEDIFGITPVAIRY